MGSQTIQSEEKGRSVIQNKVTLREIGVKKRKGEREEKIGEVPGEVIEGIIVGVQNDDTALITLSTS